MWNRYVDELITLPLTNCQCLDFFFTSSIFIKHAQNVFMGQNRLESFTVHCVKMVCRIPQYLAPIICFIIFTRKGVGKYFLSCLPVNRFIYVLSKKFCEALKPK